MWHEVLQEVFCKTKCKYEVTKKKLQEHALKTKYSGTVPICLITFV